MTSETTLRAFLKSAAVASIGMPAIIPDTAFGKNGSIAPSNRIILGGTDSVLHVRNFLDCVKSREQPVCNSTAVRYGHMACFAAAIGWKLGRKVTFNPKTESFLNDDEANRMRTYKRRSPYKI